MARMNLLESKITQRIARKRALTVFLREDFADLGGYDQVGRVLRGLAVKGKVIRIGYGLYAKATISTLSGQLIPKKPLPSLAQEALKRLGRETVPRWRKASALCLLFESAVPTDGKVLYIKCAVLQLDS